MLSLQELAEWVLALCILFMSTGRSISGFILFDQKESELLMSKYFFDTNVTAFEKELVSKLKKESKETQEIMLVDRFVLQLKTGQEVLFGILYEYAENDILISNFLEACFRALALLTGNPVSRNKVIQKLDSVFIMIDEVCENGLILEDEPDRIVSRVEMKDASTGVSSSNGTPQSSNAVSSQDWRSMVSQVRGQLGSFFTSR